MFSASSMILILSVACLLVRVGKAVFCYRCSTKKGGNTFCDSPTFISASSCAANLCQKIVETRNGEQVFLRRRCSYEFYPLGCKTEYLTSSNVYSEECFCDSSYCNKAEKFTWSLFVNLPLVVSSLFGMF